MPPVNAMFLTVSVLCSFSVILLNFVIIELRVEIKAKPVWFSIKFKLGKLGD